MRLRNCWPPIRSAGCCIPGETWHGFSDLEDDYCMLDPIKVSIVTPGVADKGGLDKRGIPASLVTKYLSIRGVEVEKTTDFTILVLFSMGITKGKWGTLLNALLDFKRDYDSNAPLAQALPQLAADYPDAYGSLGLRELADQMFAQLRDSRQTHWLAEAFSTLPKLVMTPSAAYQHLVRDEIEHVPLDKLANRVLATSVVPYPPGIPMLMPGESTGAKDGPVPRLPQGPGVVGQALPRVRARYPRHRAPRRRPVRAVPEGGCRRVHERTRPQDVADAGDDACGRQHDRHRALPAARQSCAGRWHRHIRVGDRHHRRGRARPRVRETRRAQSAAGRPVRLCARFPRPIRGLPDELRLLVRQLDRQHRNRRRGRRLSG